MSYTIKIKEKENKLFIDEATRPIVCGNTNYVLEFEFDEDWSAVETKLATFEILDKKIMAEFSGTKLNMPAMPNAYYCMLSLTCTPGEGQTLSTPALMIYLQRNEMGIEVQTMDPFVGYYSKLYNSIKKVEKGEISCSTAKHANTADEAHTAKEAEIAQKATNATYAESAGSATTASLAASATHAETADTATSATNATYAETAASATKATNATHAESATSATTAEKANFADSAETANTAETANHAKVADLATNATNATHAETATTVEFVNYATAADTAETAKRAETATTAETANFATTAHSSETQVSLTGNQTVSGEKDFVTDLKRNGVTVPNIREIANDNLLINGGFNINQRGATTYSGVNTYCVDRWKLGSDYSVATQKENGKWNFKLEGVQTAGSNIIISQTIEDFNLLAGQIVTATINYSDFTEDVENSTCLTIYDGVTNTSIVLNHQLNRMSIGKTISENATCVEVRITTSNKGLNSSIDINWCKLEVGAFSTMFSPRPYSHELWLCQRYYVRVICDGQTGNTGTLLVIQPLFVLPNTLRAQPKITSIRFPMVFGNGQFYNTIKWGFKKMQNNLISLLLTTGDNEETKNFTGFDFYCLKNGEIELDAEMY